MDGGSNKKLGLALAILATGALAAPMSANAADLGGNCCADLENASLNWKPPRLARVTARYP